MATSESSRTIPLEVEVQVLFGTMVKRHPNGHPKTRLDLAAADRLKGFFAGIGINFSPLSIQPVSARWGTPDGPKDKIIGFSINEEVTVKADPVGLNMHPRHVVFGFAGTVSPYSLNTPDIPQGVFVRVLPIVTNPDSGIDIDRLVTVNFQSGTKILDAKSVIPNQQCRLGFLRELAEYALQP